MSTKPFTRQATTSRLYGTFQWQCDPSNAGWAAVSKDNTGVRLTSNQFRLCGYLWKLFMYPKVDDTAGKIVLVYLSCIGTVPSTAVNFQLRIHNYKDADKPASHASPVLQDHYLMMIRGKGLGGVLSTTSVETLLDADKGFLHDGTLTVGVHMSVSAQEDVRKQWAHTCSQLNTSLLTSFTACLNDSLTSDVVLKAGDVTLFAHKIVLAAQSSLFKAMFQPGTLEDSCDVIEMKEIDGSTLRHLVSFMYGQTSDLSSATSTDTCWVPLFVAADAHQVEGLRWTCLQALMHRIKWDTVLEYAQLADRLSDDNLMGVCIQFLTTSDDRVKVAKQDDMKSLMQDNPDLAQKLLVAIMDHSASKRKADEIS